MRFKGTRKLEESLHQALWEETRTLVVETEDNVALSQDPMNFKCLDNNPL